MSCSRVDTSFDSLFVLLLEQEEEEEEEEEGEAWAEEELGEGEADRELTEEELQSATQVGCGLRMYVCVYFRLWSV